MAGLSVGIELLGLDEVRDSLRKNSDTKKLIPEFGLAVRRIHNELEAAVNRRYNTSKRLTSVMAGNSISDVRYGNNMLTAGLTYNVVPLPLGQFVTGVRKVPAVSYFFGKNPAFETTLNKSNIKTWATVVDVQVVRGSTKPLAGPNRYGGFLLGKRPTRVFMRKQRATWETKPSATQEGVRAPYKQLFAPSLAKMAEYCYAFDLKVQAEVNRFELSVIDNFLV